MTGWGATGEWSFSDKINNDQGKELWFILFELFSLSYLVW